MTNCSGCTMMPLCLKNPDFRRGRPFSRFTDENGELQYCTMLRDQQTRNAILSKHYHRPLPQLPHPKEGSSKTQRNSGTGDIRIPMAA